MPSRPRPPSDEALSGVVDADDARALRRYLEWSSPDAFRLAVVEFVEIRQCRAIVAWIRKLVASRRGRVRQVSFGDLSVDNLWESLRRSCPQLRRGDVLLLTGLEQSPERERLIRQLNVQRDLFVRDMARPWVLVVHRSAAADLQQDAPDFADFATLWVRTALGPETRDVPLSLQSDSGDMEPVAVPGIGTGDAAVDTYLSQLSEAYRLSGYDRVRDLLSRLGLSAPESPTVRATAALYGGRLALLEGRTAQAEQSLNEAIDAFEALGDQHSLAATLGDMARIRTMRGEADTALALLEQSHSVYEVLGDARSRAVTLGHIARILEGRGEVEAALTLHEERRAVFETLGDHRSRAIALGDIARILALRGEVDAAMALHEESRAVYESLGDLRERAITLGDIARILALRGEADAALGLHEERRAVFESLGDQRERAITLGDIARILAGRGEADAALALHEESRAVFEALGDQRSSAVTLGDIARILEGRGEADAARALHEQRFEMLEALGDPRALSVTLHDMARLDAAAGRRQSAREELERAFRLAVEVRHPDGVAFVGRDLGRLLAAAGVFDQALQVLAVAADAFRKLGRQAEAAVLDAERAAIQPAYR